MTRVLKQDVSNTLPDKMTHDDETHDTQPVSPPVRQSFRKIKSEEDFVKFQVPWIL
jgi:hypothetical protein